MVVHFTLAIVTIFLGRNQSIQTTRSQSVPTFVKGKITDHFLWPQKGHKRGVRIFVGIWYKKKSLLGENLDFFLEFLEVSYVKYWSYGGSVSI